MSRDGASPRLYAVVFAALLALTGLTFGVSYVDLGAASTAVAVSIAVVKAALVLVYFMHLRWSSALARLIAASGVFWFLVFLLLTQSDYFTRPWSG